MIMVVLVMTRRPCTRKLAAVFYTCKRGAVFGGSESPDFSIKR
jgi:hypothetical protein